MTDTPEPVAEPQGDPTLVVEPQNPQPQQTADPKPAEPAPTEAVDPKPAEPTETPDGGEKPSGDAPEPAPFEINVPEAMSLDEGTIAKLGEVAVAEGLSSEQVQKLLDVAGPSIKEANDAMLKETREAWAEAVATDPALGGKALEENMAIADKAVEAFGNEGLKELLNAEGLPLGKNPAVFSFLVRIGKAISDEKPVTPGINGKPGPAPIEGDVFQNTGQAADVMYGTKK